MRSHPALRLVPLFLAGSLFAGNEILLRGGGLLKHVGGLAPFQAVGRWSEPDFAVTAATGAVGLCGVLMLCLGVLAPQTDFVWLDPDVDLSRFRGKIAAPS